MWNRLVNGDQDEVLVLKTTRRKPSRNKLRMAESSDVVTAISNTLGFGFYWVIEGKAKRAFRTMKSFIKPSIRSHEEKEQMEKDGLQLQLTPQLNTVSSGKDNGVRCTIIWVLALLWDLKYISIPKLSPSPSFPEIIK